MIELLSHMEILADLKQRVTKLDISQIEKDTILLLMDHAYRLGYQDVELKGLKIASDLLEMRKTEHDN